MDLNASVTSAGLPAEAPAGAGQSGGAAALCAAPAALGDAAGPGGGKRRSKGGAFEPGHV